MLVALGQYVAMQSGQSADLMSLHKKLGDPTLIY